MAYPDNAPFRLDRTTHHATYADGRSTGRNWTADYDPGGPHIMRPTYGTVQGDPFWVYCKQSELNHKAWHIGFKDGLAEKRGEIVGAGPPWDRQA